jgi:hypothetical protein
MMMGKVDDNGGVIGRGCGERGWEGGYRGMEPRGGKPEGIWVMMECHLEVFATHGSLVVPTFGERWKMIIEPIERRLVDDSLNMDETDWQFLGSK